MNRNGRGLGPHTFGGLVSNWKSTERIILSFIRRHFQMLLKLILHIQMNETKICKEKEETEMKEEGEITTNGQIKMNL